MNYQLKIESLLETLPHKLQVRYALNIAKDTKHLMKAEGLECLRVVELWLQGKATREEVRMARHTAANADAAGIGIGNNATHAANAVAVSAAAYAAAYATTYAITYATTYTTTYATGGATNAAYWTAKALEVDIKIYYDKLLDFVSKLSETERMVYNINESNL